MKKEEVALYAKVIHRGDNKYIGCIEKIYTGQLDGMVEVRFPGGLAVESIAGLERIDDPDRVYQAKIWDLK